MGKRRSRARCDPIRPSILKDAADAKASRCATFPSFRDSPDIGATYMRFIGDLQTLIGEVSEDLTRCETASTDVVAADPPPSDATITAAVSHAWDRASCWSAHVRRAQTEANQILMREERTVDAAGCSTSPAATGFGHRAVPVGSRSCQPTDAG